MKTKSQPQITFTPKQPAPEGTVGFIFDYLYRKGVTEMPEGLIINANKFKGQNEKD